MSVATTLTDAVVEANGPTSASKVSSPVADIGVSVVTPSPSLVHRTNTSASSDVSLTRTVMMVFAGLQVEGVWAKTVGGVALGPMMIGLSNWAPCTKIYKDLQLLIFPEECQDRVKLAFGQRGAIDVDGDSFGFAGCDLTIGRTEDWTTQAVAVPPVLVTSKPIVVPSSPNSTIVSDASRTAGAVRTPAVVGVIATAASKALVVAEAGTMVVVVSAAAAVAPASAAGGLKFDATTEPSPARTIAVAATAANFHHSVLLFIVHAPAYRYRTGGAANPVPRSEDSPAD